MHRTILKCTLKTTNGKVTQLHSSVKHLWKVWLRRKGSVRKVTWQAKVLHFVYLTLNKKNNYRKISQGRVALVHYPSLFYTFWHSWSKEGAWKEWVLLRNLWSAWCSKFATDLLPVVRWFCARWRTFHRPRYSQPLCSAAAARIHFPWLILTVSF